MKKLFSFILALCFTLAVVAGCGSDKPKAAGNTGNTTVAASTANTNTLNNANKTALNNGKVDSVAASEANKKSIPVFEDQPYSDKARVTVYINKFGHLPKNYITKNEAKKLGWQSKGTLDKVAPGKSIGGDRFGNYEGKLPKANGRKWTECDIDYKKGNRNGKRIVFSNDGMVYYTDDHYKTFTRLH